MKSIWIIYILPLFFCWTCGPKSENGTTTEAGYTGHRKVEVRKLNGHFQLYRNNKPYYIKGAAGFEHFDKLKAYGGNSIRVWNTENAREILDEAQRLGLTVTLGLDVARERHGFDYKNKAAVQQQLEALRQEVLLYKDHPALLMWGVGNELNLISENKAMWRALNDIAAMIHATDPQHPTTTMISRIEPETVLTIRELCPAIDILSVNRFGALPDVPDEIRKSGWRGAYIVTEWGPTGFWEASRTIWDVAIEQTSSEKAVSFRERYEASIKQDTERCLGSYVFLWGTKQERTHTWFSLFTQEGEATEVVDVMQFLWTGQWPANRAPSVQALRLDGKAAQDDVFLDSKQRYKAQVMAHDANNDPLQYSWELYRELQGRDLKEGGDGEHKPEPVLVIQTNSSVLDFESPATEGAYRLFVAIHDGKQSVATANIPFYVINDKVDEKLKFWWEVAEDQLKGVGK